MLELKEIRKRRWQGLGGSGLLGVNWRLNLTVSGRGRDLRAWGHLGNWAWSVADMSFRICWNLLRRLEWREGDWRESAAPQLSFLTP